MIPDLGLDGDFEVCTDHIEDAIEDYGDLIDSYVSEIFGRK